MSAGCSGSTKNGTKLKEQSETYSENVHSTGLTGSVKESRRKPSEPREVVKGIPSTLKICF